MNMLESPWLRRLVIAKSLGFLTGLAGFLLVGWIWPEQTLPFQLGVLFWYTTLGGIIGLMGVIDRHPLFPDWRLPWWLRGTAMGAWMNLLLVLLMHDQLALMVQQFGAPDPPFESVWWIVAEGAVIGAIIDWAATRHGGEGPAIVSAS